MSFGGGGFSFGAKPAGASGPSIGATSTPGFSFGTSTAPASSAGGSSLFPAPAPATTNAFSGGFQTATFATPAVGGSLVPSASSSATSQPSMFSGGFGTGLSQTSVAQPTTSSAVSKSIGLGGIDFGSSNAKPKSGVEANKSDGKSIKASDVPAEISKLVDSFKKHVKNQKVVSEEISRVSSKQLLKVDEETIALKQLVSVVSNGIHRNTSSVVKLKKESALELKNAEIAKQTQDLPAGMQYENMAPTEYFQRLVIDFEHQMLSYKQKIEELEHHLVALNNSAPINSNELTIVVKKIHEAFIALAAELQTVHEGVAAQKDQYLNHRKKAHGDSKDIFADRPRALKGKAKASEGPSAFSHIPNAAAVAMVSALNRNHQTPTPPTLGLGNAAIMGAKPTLNNSLFPTTQSSSLLSQNSAFGSSKPSFGLTSNLGSFQSPGFGTAAQQTNKIGFGQTTSGFGSNFSFGNTSAVKPLGK